MTEEHKKAIAEGRKKYFEKKAEEKANYYPCDDCITIEFLARSTGRPVDREHCPIKCRYNKEVIKENGNND